MVRHLTRFVICSILALALLMPNFAGKAEAKGKHHKKIGFFTRVKRTIKRKIRKTVKKARRGIYKAGAKIQNKIMDGAVKAKSRLTGKKPRRVWVRGHYKKGNKHHTRGHWQTVRRTKKSRSSSSGSTGSSSPPSTSAPAPSNPPTIQTGGPLPPLDPVLPSMSIQKSKKRHR